MNENPELWEGQVIDGRFPLLQYLGRGDRSAVFATATDDGTLPSAAIKLVEANPEDAEVRLAGWAAAAALSHPHLVRVFQTGRCQLDGAELIFLVMERADEDLSQVLPLRPLSAAETSEALASILEALAYLHAQGLVHGRLRPSNILAAGDQLKISSDRLRPAGEARGRREEPDAYDAPETARGETMPADVWSLGVTLVEALTQRRQPEPALPQLPAPFDDIARHCLQPDPCRRWTVAEIQARLRQPSPAPPVEAAARPATGARGWHDLLAAALTLVLVLAAILAVPRLVNRGAEQRTLPAVPEQVESARPEAEPTAAARAAQPTSPPESVAEPFSAKASSTPSATLAPSPFPTPSPAPSAEAPPPPAQGPVAGGVLDQVLPEVPPQVRGSIHGTVKVDVKVSTGATGSVERAQLASAGSSRYFAGLAVDAARQWRFSPPTVDGQAVASEWLLHFEFDSSATTVHLERLVP